MKDQALINVSKLLEISVANTDNPDSIQEQFLNLAVFLEQLIESDFNALLSILYRIDVSESKVRTALANNEAKENAGTILARLLIEREEEKIAFRAKYSSLK